MKITRVEPIHLRLPEVTERCDGSQETLIVKVHTDAGITGIGEVDSSSLVAKATGRPAYQLLGGAFHKKLRAYASILFGDTPDETERIGRSLVQQGFRAVKFGWGP